MSSKKRRKELSNDLNQVLKDKEVDFCFERNKKTEKLVFTKNGDCKCSVCLSLTPSDINNRHSEVRYIRRTLKEKFDIDTQTKDFTISFISNFN